LSVAIATGVASLAFAEILKASLAASTSEKAFVANGSDVQGIVEPTKSIPRSFPYPATKVADLFDAALLASGQPVDVMTVDPPSLARVLAPHWSRATRNAVHTLATSRAPVPAVGVGVGVGRHVVTFDGKPTVVDVLARVRAFPGMRPSQPLLVIPATALTQQPGASFNYIWATGPPRQVKAALLQSTLAPQYLTVAADFSGTPDVQNITRTYGFLRTVAAAIVFLSLLALLLYLSSRERSQLVTSAILRRMGLSQPAQAGSVALESMLLVAFATASGLVAALATVGVIVRQVDPLSQYAPAPVAHIPWLLLVASAVGVTVVAGLAGALLTLAARRSNVGEQLRVN
jgi:hypothetical protein